MSKKRAASNSEPSCESTFDQITNLVKKSKSSETPEEFVKLLKNVQELCTKELSSIKDNKNEIKLKALLLKRFGQNEELKRWIDQIQVDLNEYERMDYHVSTSKSLSFGDLHLHRSYNGDNEGEGTINASIGFGSESFDIIPWDDEKDILSTGDLDFEDYPDLNTVYKLAVTDKKIGKKLSKEDFLSFVIAVYDDAMNAMSG